MAVMQGKSPKGKALKLLAPHRSSETSLASGWRPLAIYQIKSEI